MSVKKICGGPRSSPVRLGAPRRFFCKAKEVAAKVSGQRLKRPSQPSSLAASLAKGRGTPVRLAGASTENRCEKEIDHFSFIFIRFHSFLFVFIRFDIHFDLDDDLWKCT